MRIFRDWIGDAPELPPPPRGPMRAVDGRTLLGLGLASVAVMGSVLWFFWPYLLALVLGLLSAGALAAWFPDLPTIAHIAAGGLAGLLLGLGLVALGLA